MSFFSKMFGYILNAIYGIVNNYGIAIIIFSILIKIILLPLSIKQQKTMAKSSKIQGKVKEIQNKYKSDPEKMNKEVMALYKKENMSPFSGCLSSIIQILLLFAMFYLVRSPITFMKQVDIATIDNMKNYIKQEAGEGAISQSYPEISVIKYVSKLKNGETVKIETINEEENNVVNETIEQNDETNIMMEKNLIEENTNAENNNINEIVENNEEEKNQEPVTINDEDIEKTYINMNFLGLDLSNIPLEHIKNITSGNIGEITVLIIPLLYVISSIISMKITTKMSKEKKGEKKEIIIEKDNGEEEKKQEEPDMSTQMTKSMSLFMPIMSVSISLVAPLGLALYWFLNNILMITERIVINKILDSKEEDKNV